MASENETSKDSERGDGSKSAERAGRIATCEELIDGSAPVDYSPAVWRFNQWERKLREASMSDGESNGTSTLMSLDHTELDDGVQASPDMSIIVQRFEPGDTTEKHRHNTCAINLVLRGRGHSEIDGQRIEWGQYDTFLVPAWDYHRHTNDGDEEAILYTVQTMPLERKLRAQMWQEGEDAPVTQMIRRDG